MADSDDSRQPRIPGWLGRGPRHQALLLLAAAVPLSAILVATRYVDGTRPSAPLAEANAPVDTPLAAPDQPTPPWPTPTLPPPVSPATSRPAGPPGWLTARPTVRPTGRTPRGPGFPGARPFTPVRVEAEDPGNEMSGAGVAACAGCDGGARVRYIGGTNYLLVYVTVPVAGTRTVTVRYETDGPRVLRFRINDGAARRYDVTGTGWEVPQTLRFTAEIPAGRATFRFANDQEPAPDIDSVTIG